MNKKKKITVESLYVSIFAVIGSKNRLIEKNAEKISELHKTAYPPLGNSAGVSIMSQNQIASKTYQTPIGLVDFLINL